MVFASTAFLASFIYTVTVTWHKCSVGATRDSQQSGILANVGRYLGIVGDEVSDYSSYLNIMNFETFVYLNSSLCRSANFDGVQIPMCPFEYKVDHDISDTIPIVGGYFEKGPVTVIVNELRKNEKLEFVDLGANIGSYTVAVARLLGRHVLAVEATPETVKHLSTALRLNNATDHVTIAHNAIGNTHDEVDLRSDSWTFWLEPRRQQRQ